MDKRYVFFLVLASMAIFGNALLLNFFGPEPPEEKPAAQQDAGQQGENPPVAGAPDDKKPDDKKPEENGQPDDGQKPDDKPENPPENIAANPENQPEVDKPEDLQPAEEYPRVWTTLGSADPAGQFPFLVTFTSSGAAIERIELNQPRFKSLEKDRTPAPYLGHLALQSTPDGVKVGVVGPGTPAATAGLQVGDVITHVNDVEITSRGRLLEQINRYEPGRKVSLKVQRDGKEVSLSATLSIKPLQVVQPESTDQLSMLLTLQQLGDETIPKSWGFAIGDVPARGWGVTVGDVEEGSPAFIADLKQGDLLDSIEGETIDNPDQLREIIERTPPGTRLVVNYEREGLALVTSLRTPSELPGLDLRSGTWELKSQDNEKVVFTRTLGSPWNVRLTKTFSMVSDEDHKYEIHMTVDVENTGEQRLLAYQLDGPTGLPTEGWWYGNKISRNWGGSGVRDVVYQFHNNPPQMVSNATIISGEYEIQKGEAPLDYIGVDAQYFAVAMLPQKKNPQEIWFQETRPIRVGMVPEDKNLRKLTDVTYRVVSQSKELAKDNAIHHEFVVFSGPKQPSLLRQYGLQELVYYGWFSPVATAMLKVLHFFYGIVGNYGLAIIMLTVLVRACMFPLSMKQSLNAQKMQQLQPEMKAINEKYKKNPEQRTRAMQDLFRKHNYNPFGGCLMMFVQLPIFIGLYRSLMVDVELRQAPLIPGVAWCSNLAAPDMLWYWQPYLPAYFASPEGWLGPYFNLLPCITVVLFLVHQKMFMPPPTDEQGEMQQKIMKYMMIFMGVMFFKVASGLCLYFIASSLWGITERKLLPKVLGTQSGGSAPKESPSSDTPPKNNVSGNGSGGRGSSGKKKKQKGR